MELKNSTKELLRKKILMKRRLFDSDARVINNDNIINNTKSVLDSILEKKTNELATKKLDKLDKRPIVGLYLPMKGEPDLLKLVINSKYHFSIPKLKGAKMDFTFYHLGSALEQSAFGKLMQPVGNTELIPDVTIIPGLAFSLGGSRLGFGAGHYDRYFAKIKQNKLEPKGGIIKIGVCFHDDLHEYLPHEAHDIKLDYLITDQTIITFNHKKQFDT